MPKDIQLIIFDFDGVVVDSEIISATVLVEQFKLIGIEIDVAYVLEHYLGRSFDSMKDSVYRVFGVSLNNAFEYEYREALFNQFATELKTTVGFKQMLNKLSVNYCIATSSAPLRAAYCLKLVGLTDAFAKNVYTASQVKHGKPAPDLFLFAAKQMQVPADKCLVIEDSTAGLAAASAANMQALHYQGGQHLTGPSAPEIILDGSVRQLNNWHSLQQMYQPLFKKQNNAEKLLNLN
ncbi:hypothetical protein DS2_16464 [Catenovulum agarivorans DS-2]|uniref:Hydrolase n=1 Tax=Catenovulum agarivorans DS-2 TaxID=1328313 RepID=W7Q9J3_9ALTE|nr:HAD-IA family hydrolase [Catenovulum agarivorans]EWH08626.1 hypothetical protein DS2_16464 [Catenovulum agarivorans DS-2]